LGGVSRYEGVFSYALNDYPLTVDSLRNNYKKVKRKVLFTYFVSILMLPIIIPFALVKMVISIIKIPFEMSRGLKAVKKHYPDEFNDK